MCVCIKLIVRNHPKFNIASDEMQYKFNVSISKMSIPTMKFTYLKANDLF